MTKTETTELTPTEMDAAQARELTDAELEAVAGGKDVVVNNRRPGPRPFPGRWPRR